LIFSFLIDLLLIFKNNTVITGPLTEKRIFFEYIEQPTFFSCVFIPQLLAIMWVVSQRRISGQVVNAKERI